MNMCGDIIFIYTRTRYVSELNTIDFIKEAKMDNNLNVKYENKFLREHINGKEVIYLKYQRMDLN